MEQYSRTHKFCKRSPGLRRALQDPDRQEKDAAETGQLSRDVCQDGVSWRFGTNAARPQVG
jgi:hypothetical protein